MRSHEGDGGKNVSSKHLCCNCLPKIHSYTPTPLRNHSRKSHKMKIQLLNILHTKNLFDLLKASTSRDGDKSIAHLEMITETQTSNKR